MPFMSFSDYLLQWRMLRPKKRCLFALSNQPILENWKPRAGFSFFFFFFFDTQFCIFKQKCWNKMSEFFMIAPKRFFFLTRYNGIQPPSNTRIKPLLRLCMPKNGYTWMIMHFFCIQIFKKKEIDLSKLPILRPKGQTNLLFFRPYLFFKTESSGDYFETAHKTCSILGWGAVPP